MASSFSESLTRAWYQGALWLLLLWPLACLFFVITLVRRWLYRSGIKKSYRSPAPVIVVGNVTVGGAGKSPLVAYLVANLQNSGYRPGVLSRGYGANVEPNEPRLVEVDSLPSQVGDEPLMLKRKLACPVAVCPNRKNAIELLLAQGCDVLVSDDGLQHLAMERDLEVCVFDGERMWGNGRLLPSGPLREPLSRLESVNYVVINGGADPAISFPVPCYSMVLGAQELCELNSDRKRSLVDACADLNQRGSGVLVHAVAGIGNPERFFKSLEEQGFVIERHPFNDHHQFENRDFQGFSEQMIIMTEKDAVKCKSLKLNDAWYLPVQAQLNDNLAQQIVSDLQANGRLK